MTSGFQARFSPLRRHWYCRRGRAPPVAPLCGKARAWRRTASAAMRSRPVAADACRCPVKYRSTTSSASPMASKSWAPQYERMVEMPILRDGLEQALAQRAGRRWAARRQGRRPRRPRDRELGGCVEEQIGSTASAPYPMSSARWGDLARFAALHDERRHRCGCARGGGDGGRRRCQERGDGDVAGVAPRSLRMRMVDPPPGLGRQAADRLRPSSRPLGSRRRGWKTAVIVSAGNWRWVTWRMVARSAAVRMGWGSSRRAACAGPLLEEVAAGPQRVSQADITDRLPDGIDGRVGHLGEELLEVREERLGARCSAPPAGRHCPSSPPAPRRRARPSVATHEAEVLSVHPKRVLADAQVPGSGSLLSSASWRQLVEVDCSTRGSTPRRGGGRKLSLARAVVEGWSGPPSVSTSSNRPGSQPPLL